MREHDLHELLHLVLSRVMPLVDSDEEERIVLDLTEAFLASDTAEIPRIMPRLR